MDARAIDMGVGEAERVPEQRNFRHDKNAPQRSGDRHGDHRVIGFILEHLEGDIVGVPNHDDIYAVSA